MPKFGFESTADDVIASYGAHAIGRTFLVTGPSTGSLGDATATALARAGAAKLILVGRTPENFATVAQAVRSLGVEVREYGVDLSSMTSVRSGAEKILEENDHIDVLVNNAGVSGIANKSMSADGIELMFATNHLGPFLLTNLLMPAILRSNSPRIVTLSSAAHGNGTGEYEDLNFEKKEYTWFKAYAESKLANIYFTQYIAKALGPRGIVALAVHPGTIWETSLVRDLSKDDLSTLKEFVAGRQVVPKTLAQGAATTLVAALDPTARDYNGAYLADCVVAPALGEAANRAELSESLWKLSEKLAGQTFVY